MNIHLSNLNRQVTKANIMALLVSYSSVTHCTIHHVKHFNPNIVNTFAIVDFDNPADVESAIDLLDGALLGGKKIRAQIGN